MKTKAHHPYGLPFWGLTLGILLAAASSALGQGCELWLEYPDGTTEHIHTASSAPVPFEQSRSVDFDNDGGTDATIMISLPQDWCQPTEPPSCYVIVLSPAVVNYESAQAVPDCQDLMDRKRTPVATHTPTSTRDNSNPTETPTPTETFTPTDTPTETATSTPSPTFTVEPGASATATPFLAKITLIGPNPDVLVIQESDLDYANEADRKFAQIDAVAMTSEAKADELGEWAQPVIVNDETGGASVVVVAIDEDSENLLSNPMRVRVYPTDNWEELRSGVVSLRLTYNRGTTSKSEMAYVSVRKIASGSSVMLLPPRKQTLKWQIRAR